MCTSFSFLYMFESFRYLLPFLIQKFLINLLYQNLRKFYNKIKIFFKMSFFLHLSIEIQFVFINLIYRTFCFFLMPNTFNFNPFTFSLVSQMVILLHKISHALHLISHLFTGLFTYFNNKQESRNVFFYLLWKNNFSQF